MRVRWRRKLRRILAVLFVAFVCFCPDSLAQDGELDPSQPKDITANAIIQRFTAKEKEWKQLREQYTFRHRFNSRHWMATRWLENTARLQISATSRTNV